MKRMLYWVGGTLAVALIVLVISWGRNMPGKDLLGVWQTEGYGLVLDVGRDLIDVYQTSDLHCTRDMRIPAHLWLVEAMEGATFTHAPTGDSQEASMQINVASTLNPIEATRIAELPATCDAPMPGDAQTTFDVMWEVMNTHYAHFDTHGVDWAARKALRPEGPLDDAALLDVMREALAGLDDGHTFIAAGTEVWSPALRPSWFDDRIAVRDATLAAVADLSTLDEHGLQVGWAAPGIGYVLISHMEPPARFNWTSAEVASGAFAQVTAFLQDAQGVIVDVRYNPGGSDDVALAYAGFFTDTARPVLTKTTRTKTGYTAPFTAMLDPQVPGLPMPTVLLTSGFTGSAAEIFTMAMRELPQVTVMGEATSGSLSDVLTFRLPNGWDLGLSNQIYLVPDGTSYEGIGLPPDVPFPIDVAAARAGGDTLLDAAIAALQ